MTISFQTMKVVEIIDWIAEQKGFIKVPESDTISFPHWVHKNGGIVWDKDGIVCRHVYEETLDDAFSLLPKSWFWVRKLFAGKILWIAEKETKNGFVTVSVKDTGDILKDVWHLVALCIDAERKMKNGE